MKTIGLIGGMSWQSTAEYYKIINKLTEEKLGGKNSSKIIIYSLNFKEITKLLESNRWDKVEEIILDSSLRVEKAGADFILIATNTIHKIADSIESKLSVPLINIVDSVGEEILNKGLKKVLLLGTKFTMEDGFYQRKLMRKYKIETLIPDMEERKTINKIIFDELVLGEISRKSREKLLKLIKKYRTKSEIEGVILGCTELPLLIKKSHLEIPLINSTYIHAKKAVYEAIKK